MSATDSMKGRVVALGAMMQALSQVRQLAENGGYDESATRPIIHSVLRIDSPDPLSIYGNRHALSRGLSLLREYLQRSGADETVAKMAMTVMQMERNLVRDSQVQQEISQGIAQLQTQDDDSTDALMRPLGELYSRTVSLQRPSVIVTGNPQYLERSEIVTEIRALLFGAVRAAVLWRQMGGTALDFLLRRKAMLQAMESL